MADDPVEYTAPAIPVPPARVVALLDNGTKVKERIPRMRACDERNEKGKFCMGHLKRYYDLDSADRGLFGSEIYRCERCKTLYLPNPEDPRRTRVMSW